MPWWAKSTDSQRCVPVCIMTFLSLCSSPSLAGKKSQQLLFSFPSHPGGKKASTWQFLLQHKWFSSDAAASSLWCQRSEKLPRSAQSASPWLLCLAEWICFINYSRESPEQAALSLLHQGRQETVPSAQGNISSSSSSLSLNYHNCQRLFPPHLRLLGTCQVGSPSLPTWKSVSLSPQKQSSSEH